MSGEKIKATDVLAEAFSILWREKELLVLLAALMTVVGLLFLWPLLGMYAEFLAAYMAQGTPDLEALDQFGQSMSEISYIYYLIIPQLLFQMSILTLWTRASILGKGQALDGGLRGLFNRSLWVFWRYICTMGWMLLMGIAIWVVIFGIVLVLGAGGALTGGEGASGALTFLLILLIIPLYLVFIFALMGLMFLMSVSIHGEARDLRLPIHKSFGYIKGNLLRGTGVLILFLLGFYFIYIFGVLFIFGIYLTAPVWVTAIGMFAIFFLGMLFNFAWVTYGAIYASKLVPELRA